MSRAALVPLLGLGVLLAGCPIPQPLPEYSAGTVTPPRILMDEVPFSDDAVIFVPANCPTTAEPVYPLWARFVDSNTLEGVEARWFVNYDWRDRPHNRIWQASVIPPNADPNNLTRTVPTWTFAPYEAPPPRGVVLTGPPYPDADVVRVVELVVSNGFDPALLETIAIGANRAPKPKFETQNHRWVFVTSSLVPCP